MPCPYIPGLNAVVSYPAHRKVETQFRPALNPISGIISRVSVSAYPMNIGRGNGKFPRYEIPWASESR